MRSSIPDRFERDNLAFQRLLDVILDAGIRYTVTASGEFFLYGADVIPLDVIIGMRRFRRTFAEMHGPARLNQAERGEDSSPALEMSTTNTQQIVRLDAQEFDAAHVIPRRVGT